MIIIMARTQSERVKSLREYLIGQLRQHVYMAGDRFPSARTIAADHSVSYQTAHRLLEGLSNEGYLERRSGSGTFVPGLAARSLNPPREVVLVMAERAWRPDSFGARLLAGLARQLSRRGIPWRLMPAESAGGVCPSLPDDGFPVLWEAPRALENCRLETRRALLLNAYPAPGLDATLLDSVSLDDYFGGCCAADLLRRRASDRFGFAVVSGPDDARSNNRLAGFLSKVPDAAVIPAGDWYMESGLAVAAEALRRGAAGIFCVNDRLAQAILIHAREHGYKRPPLVGFDNAPIASDLNLTTIAIPWGEMAADAVHIIERRMTGDDSAARRRLISPQPIVREL
jgi:hypothetical protein